MKSKITSHQTALSPSQALAAPGENMQRERALGAKSPSRVSSPFLSKEQQSVWPHFPQSWSNCGQRLCRYPNRGKQSSAVAWKRHQELSFFFFFASRNIQWCCCTVRERQIISWLLQHVDQPTLFFSLYNCCIIRWEMREWCWTFRACV